MVETYLLELSGSNLIPKASSWEKNCPSTYKGYVCHILKWCGTLTLFIIKIMSKDNIFTKYSGLI